MQKILFLISFLTYSISFSQVDKKFLDGDWIIYKREMKDGSKYFSQEIVTNPHKIYIYNKNFFLFKDYIHNEKETFPIPFRFETNKIIFSENRYNEVEKLTDSELIFTEVFEGKTESNLIKYYLKKYNVLQKEDLIKISDKDTLSTTMTVTPVPNTDVFKNIVINNNSVFKVKGYLLFDLKTKYIKTYITNSENLSKENREKIISTFNNSYNSWNLKDVKKFQFIKMPFIVIGYEYNPSNNIYRHVIAAYNVNNYDEIVTPINNQNIKNSENFFKLGLRCYENQDYNCAIQNFEKSALENKFNLDAHYNYASICFALGRKIDACKKWNELISYGQKQAETEYQINCK